MTSLVFGGFKTPSLWTFLRLVHSVRGAALLNIKTVFCKKKKISILFLKKSQKILLCDQCILSINKIKKYLFHRKVYFFQQIHVLYWKWILYRIIQQFPSVNKFKIYIWIEFLRNFFSGKKCETNKYSSHQGKNWSFGIVVNVEWNV
jgi:hypothetical protein